MFRLFALTSPRASRLRSPSVDSRVGDFEQLEAS